MRREPSGRAPALVDDPLELTTAVPIQRTKLYRPPVAVDLVPREELCARLEAGRRSPLTLVSAPAGYGKTSLVSHWLETRGAPSAWLSLDETDGDLGVFLRYLLAAVRTLFPDACRASLALVDTAELPPVPVLVRHLSNDLDRVATDRVATDRVATDGLGEPFVLALDDYHRVGEPAVHELVDRLLSHPPRGLHLVVMTRRDPPLSLAALRSHHRMTEIRMEDLQFTSRETASFLEQAAGRPIDASVLPRLHEKTEGWPVALRLAALALQYGAEVDGLARGIASDTRQVREYLVAEVLSHQTPAVREWLYKTSILDRFCAPLCEVVCGSPATRSEDGALDGREFVRILESSGLLCVPLDERHEWFRFHHLLGELLQRRGEARTSPEERAALHLRASGWLAENGRIEEAIRHALRGGDAAAAARLVAERGSEALNREQFPALAQWLAMLPAAIVDQDPRLLLLRAFSLEQRYAFDQAFDAVDQAEALLAARAATARAATGRAATGQPSETALDRRLRGEIEVLRSQQHFMAAEGERGVTCGERAMALLPPEAQSARGHAILLLALTLEMAGDLPRARNVLYQALEGHAYSTFHTRVLMSLCWVDWVAADLTSLGQAASRLLQLAGELQLPESRDLGRYFLGTFHYQRNELVEAQRYLEPLAAEPFSTRMELYTHGSFALALARLAQGRGREARVLGEAVVAHLLEIESVFVLPMARAFLAELDLRQGHMARAAHWAANGETGPLLPMYMAYVPELTQAKIWIAQGEPASLQRAAGLLTRLHDYVSKTHNRRFLIEVLAAEALLHDAEGDEAAALTALAKAVSLAHPAGALRPFVDLGPGLAKLLHRLDLEEDALHYVGEILATLQSEQHVGRGRVGEAAPGSQPLPEPLTPRELEVLALLARRLSNREIADRLVISTGTVKVHTHNIYGKVGVSGRREVVTEALGLGIIDAP